MVVQAFITVPSLVIVKLSHKVSSRIKKPLCYKQIKCFREISTKPVFHGMNQKKTNTLFGHIHHQQKKIKTKQQPCSD